MHRVLHGHRIVPAQDLPGAGRGGEGNPGSAASVGDGEPAVTDPRDDIHDAGEIRVGQDGDRGGQVVTISPDADLIARGQGCVVSTGLDRERALAAGHDQTLPARHGPPGDIPINAP